MSRGVRDPSGSAPAHTHGCCIAGAAECCPPVASAARGIPEPGVLVLDVVYILGIIAVFVVVGLIARGVEKL